MSAWMVSAAHLDLLASKACDDPTGRLYLNTAEARAEARDLFGDEQPKLYGLEPQIGAILHRANCASLNARYPDSEADGSMGQAVPYTWRRADCDDPRTVLMAVRCFRYQACEYEGWERSLAAAICDHISEAQIRQLTEGQPWGIDEQHVRRGAVSFADMMRKAAR